MESTSRSSPLVCYFVCNPAHDLGRPFRRNGQPKNVSVATTARGGILYTQADFDLPSKRSQWARED